MSVADGLLSWLTSQRSRHLLRVCNEVGAGAVLDGWPTIGNHGRMRIGKRFRLTSVPTPSHIISGPEGLLEIGDDVAIGHGAAVASFAVITIGSGTRIAPFAVIMDTDFHVVGDSSRQAGSEPIAIGAGVRIGSHVTILRGSEIGDGAVVAAGSVVAGKVPRGAVVSGVPAREAMRREEDAGEPATDRVPKVVMQSLGLSRPPALEDGPSQIPQWDSLGALRLLLALEDSFGVTLSEDEVLRVATVGDLASVVERALG